MFKPVILLGSGGHAKVLAAVLKKRASPVLGVTDPGRDVGNTVFDWPVLGDDSALLQYPPDTIELVNGIGSIPKDNGLRRQLFAKFHDLGYQFKNVIDQRALIADEVSLAEGVQVMSGAIIQAGTQIACNAIINSGAIIEHDCVLGQHVHVAPGAVLCGAVVIGDNVHVGAGAVVIQGVTIGSGCIIGAGCVVTRGLEPCQTVYPPRSMTKI
ncbi:MAG: acetyltransferase [Methylococcaceae bacterium]|jgi:UDP-perosamine 4-acetyltransferase